jgi:tetratricopeptide (TPR) repeat protein
LAHQIVVVDTGSTDRTVEIAKEYGAEVHPFTWCDDFSAARNAALEHATGDWVLSLDADEELSAQGRDALRRHLADSAVMAWRLPLMDVGKEADGRSFVPRLFRNAPGFCFTGRVHEQIFTAVDRQRAQWGLDNRLGEALLLHHGYTDEAMRDRNKVERNLRLLEQAVTEQPGDPHLLMNLGLELSRSGREAEALERYREAFEILSALPKDQIPPELREAFLSQYCVRLKANRRFAEVVEVLSSPLAHAQNGLNASNHFNCGLAHLELGHFREAAEQMKHCLAKRKQPVITVVNKDIHTAGPFHILGMALAQIGDVAGAEKAYREGLNERGHADRLRFDFARFLFEQRRPVDALQMLNDALKEPTDLAPAMWRLGGTIALSQPQFLEFALEWTGEAVKNLPDSLEVAAQHGEALLLSQRPEAALPCWERVWQNQSQPQALAALVLCELAQGQPQHSPRNAAESAAASKAFIEWYRKCLQANAKDLIVRVNSRLAALRPVLPEAANLLEQALAESEIAEPAAARG